MVSSAYLRALELILERFMHELKLLSLLFGSGNKLYTVLSFLSL